MAFELPALPYSRDALAPHISGETIDYHYGKHHQAYVTNLNNLVAADASLAGKSLEDIIASSKGGLFNNAAQVWNHTFYWHSLSPQGGGAPTGALADAITAAWGSFDAFKAEFTKAALGQFGSGWAWLVADKAGKLSIRTTANAETPLTDASVTSLLTCDVWEHAYYVDYRNARANYVAGWWALVNWDFAAANFAKATA
jgi:Fe-Mn family superoxide dismutase